MEHKEKTTQETLEAFEQQRADDPPLEEPGSFLEDTMISD